MNCIQNSLFLDQLKKKDNTKSVSIHGFHQFDQEQLQKCIQAINYVIKANSLLHKPQQVKLGSTAQWSRYVRLDYFYLLIAMFLINNHCFLQNTISSQILILRKSG